MMKMQWAFLVKAYLVPTIIIVFFLTLLQPYAVSVLGSMFGSITLYVAQGGVIVVGIWVARKAEKVIN
jgi:hypothetical protein